MWRCTVCAAVGIQYYTGQFFDLASITAAARGKGCVMGLDLAHAVGNVPLALHDWGVDFACWCMYKYMNCGPGAIGGCFVHSRHSQFDDIGMRWWFMYECTVCMYIYACMYWWEWQCAWGTLCLMISVLDYSVYGSDGWVCMYVCMYVCMHIR